MDNSTHDARIERAIADLDGQDKPNIRAMARAGREHPPPALEGTIDV